MSVALDVNILVYASHPESPLNGPARDLITELSHGPDLLCFSWPVLSGYVRIVTNPRVFPRPLSPIEATDNVTALVARQRTRVLTEQDGFWEIYGALLREHRARGDLVPDVHLAALLRQHGVRTLYTHDRDFRRFDVLDVRDPFAA